MDSVNAMVNAFFFTIPCPLYYVEKQLQRTKKNSKTFEKSLSFVLFYFKPALPACMFECMRANFIALDT